VNSPPVRVGMRASLCIFRWYFDIIINMRLRKSAHTVYKTQYHIVWITRFWRKILLKGVKVVEIIKSNTSRALKRKFTFLQKVYWDEKGIWAKGYFVSTVGINEKIIQAYVKMQGEEDTGQAELEF